MRSSILVLVFATVFALARPIEDAVDIQDVADLARKPASRPAPKLAAKKPSTMPTSSHGKSISSHIISGVVDITGQTLNGAASGTTSVLTQAAVDAVTGGGEVPVTEEPVPEA